MTLEQEIEENGQPLQDPRDVDEYMLMASK